MKKSIWAKVFGAISALAITSCGTPGLEIGHVAGLSVNCALAGIFAFLAHHNASSTDGQK